MENGGKKLNLTYEFLVKIMNKRHEHVVVIKGFFEKVKNPRGNKRSNW